MKIVYLGNKLSKHGYTATSIDTFGVLLDTHFDVILGSEVRNPIGRLLHMILLVFRYRKSDVLLIDTYSTAAFWYAFITAQLARMLKLPYIPILHGGSLPLRAERTPRLTRMLLEKAKSVVCPSDYLLYEMKAFFERDYIVIPNYIEIEKYPFRLRNVSRPIRLLWVRSFHKIYNPKLAVEIVKGLVQKGFSVKLAMVGPDKDGSLQATMDYASELGVSEIIEFTGRLSKTDWIELANEYDVFINTTNVDNTPVSVMEAMALGMVVVSTDVGGIPYLLDSNLDGILVPLKDATPFVEVIMELVENPATAYQLSENGREKAESWDWKVVEQQWLELLRS